MTTSEDVAPLSKDLHYINTHERKSENAVENTAEYDKDYKNGERRPLLRGDEDRSGDNLVENNKSKSVWKDTTWRQKTVVLYVSLVNYISLLCYSVSAPFLARVMLQKGGTIVLSTLILQISMLSMAVFSIIFGKYQTKIGSKTLIALGQVVLGLSQIAFGTIMYIENRWAVVAVGLVMRSLQGASQAATSVAGLTIGCQELPEFMSAVFGIFEAAYGAGYLTGPYIGGFLYDWSNGTMVPMAISGLISILFSVAGYGILKKSSNWQAPTASGANIRRILSKPKAVLIMGGAGAVIGGFGLCDSTITVYLETLGFTATKVGQLLFTMGASYCIFAIVIGFAIRSRKVLRRCILCFGFLGAFGFGMLWQPSQQLALIYVAAFGFGMCIAFAFIASFEELREVVSSDDGESSNDVSLNSALSGLWSASLSIFNFIDPLIGSALQTAVPFFVSFASSLLVGFGMTICAVLLSSLYKHISK